MATKVQNSSKDNIDYDVLTQLEWVLKSAPNYEITMACRAAMKEIKALRRKRKKKGHV